MTALRDYARDAGLPALAGDSALRPPSPDEALSMGRAALVLPGGPELRDAAWEHARWTPREACTALFRVTASDGRVLQLCVERRARPRGRAVRSAEDPRLAEALPGLRPLAELDDGTLAWWYPADRALPGARRVQDPSRTRRLLASCARFADVPIRGHRSQLTLLRYKPGQRAVLRLDVAVRAADGARGAVPLAVRVLPPRKAQRALAARSSCRACDELGARVVAREERSGLVFEEWLDGRTADPLDFGGARDVGRMLARLHAVPAEGVAVAAEGPEFLDLFQVDQALLARARTLAGRPRPAIRALRWIHGDLHPDQILRRPDGSPALLDWDALRAGDPAEDLASWWTDALAAGDAAGGGLDELLDGYERAGGTVPDERALRAWAARGLLMRAAAAIRRLESGAVARAARLLDLAEEHAG